VNGARPLSGTGSFPSDPSFDMVWNGQASSTAIPASDPHRFFLVTNAGIGGAEGPSGSYAP